MNDNGIYKYAKEADSRLIVEKSWNVFIVDDDPVVLRTTESALESFHFKGKKVNMSFFTSAAKANIALNEDDPDDPEVAVILLDIVMEDSGFDVIDFLKNVKQNNITQIILRTGQAGKTVQQEHEIARNYEINDFIDKSDNSYKRLHTSITTSLRMFELLKTLSGVQRNLDIFNASLLEFFNLKKENIAISKEDHKLLINCIFSHLNNNYYKGKKKLTQGALEKLLQLGPHNLQVLFKIISNAFGKSESENILDEDISNYCEGRLYWLKDVSSLKNLYDALCGNNNGKIVNEIKFIASDTPWDIFKDHHKNLIPSSPIHWVGNISDLLYLYFALTQASLISNNIWKNIHDELELHYRNKNGMIKSDVIKSYKAKYKMDEIHTSVEGITSIIKGWDWYNPYKELIDKIIKELL